MSGDCTLLDPKCSRDVLIEKHWGALIDRSVSEYYWNELAKFDGVEREARRCFAPELFILLDVLAHPLQIPAIINTPHFYMFHYKALRLLLLEGAEHYVDLTHQDLRFISLNYFGDTMEKTLRANFVTVGGLKLSGRCQGLLVVESMHELQPRIFVKHSSQSPCSTLFDDNRLRGVSWPPQRKVCCCRLYRHVKVCWRSQRLPYRRANSASGVPTARGSVRQRHAVHNRVEYSQVHHDDPSVSSLRWFRLTLQLAPFAIGGRAQDTCPPQVLSRTPRASIDSVGQTRQATRPLDTNPLPNSRRSLDAQAGTKGVVVTKDVPEGILSNVPWRRAGVKHSSNEIFFDITEEVDVTLNRDGQVVRTDTTPSGPQARPFSAFPLCSLSLRWLKANALSPQNAATLAICGRGGRTRVSASRSQVGYSNTRRRCSVRAEQMSTI
eukprot:1179403-Prorocentrum_minimum.AAC.2